MMRRHATAVLRALAVVSSIIYLARLSWARWADPLIDFGQQLYLPWQVAEGKHLYGELAYYNGPLSVWLNAAAFRLFGTSLWTLIGCNALVLLAILFLVYWLFRSVSNPWGGTLAALVFIWLFAFGKYIENSNYNYLCPYNHEITHGLCLALALIAILWQGVLTRRCVAPAAGVMLGLALLTKAELSLAAIAASLTHWAMSFAAQPRARWSAVAARLAIFCACAILPPLGAFSYLASRLPLRQAWEGTIGSWAVALTPEIRNLYFYRAGLGTINLEKNLTAMTLGCLVYGLFLLINLGAAYVLAAAAAAWRYAATLLIGIGFMGYLAEHFPMTEVYQPIPFVLLGIGVWLITTWRKAPDEATRTHAGRRLTLTAFAGILLLKMAFNTRVVHYGFVLAMPAVLVVFAAFASWLPTALSARGLYGGCLAGSSALMVLFCIVVGQAAQHTYYLRPASPIGSGADYFVSESPKAETVARMAAILAAKTRPEDRVLVFPEGVMLNYLSRRETGVPFTNFMPPESLFFGENPMLAALERHPPDWIVIAPKNLVEYDVRLGQGFLDNIVAWIDGHYDVEIKLQGPKGCEMILLKHRSSATVMAIGKRRGEF